MPATVVAAVSPAPRCTSASHDALKATAWAELGPPSYWQFGDALLEQRECPRCHTHLARPIQIIAKLYLDEQTGEQALSTRGAS